MFKSDSFSKRNVRLFLVCFYAGLCMFLSAIEYAIPKPLPFLRLGLANLPIIIAIKIFSFREYLILILLKVFTQALISGTLLSYIFVFSFCGTFSSALVMWLLYGFLKSKQISNVGLSVAGSFANVGVQIGLCYLMLFGNNTKYIVVLILSFGFVSGLLLGIFCNLFERNSSFVSISQKFIIETDVSINLPGNLKPVDKHKITNVSLVLIPVLGLLFMFIICIVENFIVRWIFVFLSFIISYVLNHGKVKILPSIIIFISIVIVSLFQPNGRLLITCGNFQITENALIMGLNKSGKLIGMVFCSKIILSKKFNMPGLLGSIFGNVVRSFNILTSKKIIFKKNNILKLLDDWITQCFNEYSTVYTN